MQENGREKKLYKGSETVVRKSGGAIFPWNPKFRIMSSSGLRRIPGKEMGKEAILMRRI